MCARCYRLCQLRSPKSVWTGLWSNRLSAPIMLIDQTAQPTRHVILKKADEGRRAYNWTRCHQCSRNRGSDALLSSAVSMSLSLGPLCNKSRFCVFFLTAHNLYCPMWLSGQGVKMLTSLTNATHFLPQEILRLEPDAGFLSMGSGL